MVVILFGVAIGYFANKIGILNGDMPQKLSKLVLTFLLPLKTVAAVATGEALPSLPEVLSILRVAVLFYGMEIIVALIIPRFLKASDAYKGAWRFVITFPNVGFIGYPVAIALFGPEALVYAVILVLPFNLINYTLGPLMLAGAKRFSWKQFFTPCIIASVLALVMTLTGYRPPTVVGECLSLVGDTATPISLLIVGAMLAPLSIKKVLLSPGNWALTVLRLLILPAMFYPLLKTMDLSHMVFGVALTQMAMPSAINGIILSLEYGGDTDTMAQVTFLTTLMATFTIPIITALFL